MRIRKRKKINEGESCFSDVCVCAFITMQMHTCVCVYVWTSCGCMYEFVCVRVCACLLSKDEGAGKGVVGVKGVTKEGGTKC